MRKRQQKKNSKKLFGSKKLATYVFKRNYVKRNWHGVVVRPEDSEGAWIRV